MKKIFILFLSLLTLSPSAYSQLNISLQGDLDYDEETSDIWGYTDALGNEYALVGTTDGVSIVDISPPTTPTELHYIDGTFTIWRDLKTYGNYAYVINEATNGGGLLIIDLSNVATSITTYTSDLGVGYTDSHNIFIDENGIAYLFGSTTSGPNNVGTGTLMIDVAANPTNPTYLGVYDDNYVHDGFVRGDTLWAAEIYAGQLAVVDVSNKTNPTVLGTKATPKDFAHAVWVSDNNQTAFVTEEKSDAWVVAYDVSDVDDIQELDRYKSFPGTNVIPHNTFVKGNFIINSYYTSGVIVLDATHPDNLIEVGNYDTATGFSGNGFNGCWGVYPYFPSGTIIASDIETGLYVFTPTYIQACYLEGIVTDAETTDPIANAQLQILGATNAFDGTDFQGSYKTGVSNTGTYTVEVVADGFLTQYIEVNLPTNGTLINLDVQMNRPCAAPENISIVSVDYQEASLMWDAAIGGINYTFRYRSQGSSDWQTENTENTSITLTELTGCTTYEYQISSECSADESDFSSLQTFQTTTPDATWAGISLLECEGDFDLNTLVTGDTGGTWSGSNFVNNNGIFSSTDLIDNNYPVTYTVGAMGCTDSHTANVAVETCKLTVKLKVFLGGAYDTDGQMNTGLNDFSLIPNEQPFNRAPWNYEGLELTDNLPNTVSDWVLVELRDAADMTLVSQAAGFLLNNGQVVNTNTPSTLGLEIEGAAPNKAYFIVVRARNHLAVMSATTIGLPNANLYDFTLSNAQTLGTNQMNSNGDGSFSLVGGDINSDGIISVEDFNFFGDEQSLFNQYLDSDLNQDRAVTVSDFNIYLQNASKMSIPLLRY
ncbi:MAG: choice-of-anchor B family protein [Chitinophagales bacterium]